MQDLHAVLSLMRQHKLFPKRSKCTFGGLEIDYLGFIVNKNGVSTDPQKVEAVLKWPRPRNAKQLRGFLGLAGYYQRFVRSFGIIAKPLTNLLRKNAYQWSDEAQHTFDNLKQALSLAAVLALPDFSQPFVIETNASGTGIGAVLMQQKHPLAFISKSLSARQQALSVYERELLAILLAVKSWHHYLIVARFIIKTDQKSLKHLMEQKVNTPLQHVWLSLLMVCDFEIFYKQGKENIAADALSRVHGGTLLALTLSTFDPLLLDKLKTS